MNIFGILLLILIIRVLLLNKPKGDKYLYIFSLLILLELFVNTGYFIKFGEYELLYSEFVLIVLILFSLSLLIHRPINKKLLFCGLMFLGAIIITELMLIINPLEEPILRNNELIVPEFSLYSLMIASRYLLFVIVALAAKSVFGKEKVINVVGLMQKYSIFFIFLLYIEWILNNVLKVDYFRRGVSFIFGKGAYTVDALLTRGGLHSIQGFMREPAHLSEGLFYFLLIVILAGLDKRKTHRLILISAPLILLSGSFSGILYLIALFVIYMAKNKITSVYTIGVLILILISLPFLFSSELFQYYYTRLMNSFRILTNSQTSTTISSEAVRLNTVIYTFDAFLKRPLFGLGIGIPYSYGFLSGLLASIGSIGSTLWMLFVFKLFGNLRINIRTIFIIVAMIVVWNFTGNISVSYSVFILLIAVLIDGNYLAENNKLWSVKQ